MKGSKASHHSGEEDIGSSSPPVLMRVLLNSRVCPNCGSGGIMREFIIENGLEVYNWCIDCNYGRRKAFPASPREGKTSPLLITK